MPHSPIRSETSGLPFVARGTVACGPGAGPEMLWSKTGQIP